MTVSSLLAGSVFVLWPLLLFLMIDVVNCHIPLTVVHMADWVRDKLPNLAAILFAASALGLAFLPSELQRLERRQGLRFLGAGLGVVIGIGGWISGSQQKTASSAMDAFRRYENEQFKALDGNIDRLSKTPESPERQVEVRKLKQDILDLRARGNAQGNKSCPIESGQLEACNPVQVSQWCDPLLDRIKQAMNTYTKEKSELPLSGKWQANIGINEFLQNDHQSLVQCRAALVSKIKGGDNLFRHCSVMLGTIVFETPFPV